MSLKSLLKKNKAVVSFYEFIVKYYFRLLTIISPELNTRMRYKRAFKKPLDLNNPVTLNEKNLKLKLERYSKDPLVKQCADKYAVREYIKQKGCEDILVNLIASYDRVDDIDFDALPNQFAMKWNFGCGFNIICSDKSKLDIVEVKRKMKKWGRSKQHLDFSEMQYKGVEKKIIVEEYLKPKNGLLPEDYKVYCFHGEPMFILVCVGREHGGHPKFYFFDKDWNLARINRDSKNAPEGFSIEKPVCLDKLLDSARKLSEPFPFVRADFYIVNDKVYFGELTFTPAGALDAARLPETDLMFGNLLKI